VANHLIALLAKRARRGICILQIEIDLGRLRLAEFRVPVVEQRAIGIEQLALDDAETPILLGQLHVVLDELLAPSHFAHQLLHLGFRAKGADALKLIGHDARALAERPGPERSRGALLRAAHLGSAALDVTWLTTAVLPTTWPAASD
jgi:hypothetical protein